MERRDWLWFGGFLLLGLLYWQCRGEDGSGTPVTVTREVPSFTAVEVKGDLRLEVTIGAEQKVEISGDDNLVPLLETRVSRDKLIIRSEENLDPELPLIVRITAPSIREIDGSGSVEIEARGLDADAFKLALDGSGEITAEGRADRLVLDVSGSADADLKRLASKVVEVDISGSGDVDLAAPEELDVDISGSATVTYEGKPRITQDISGSGEITRR